MRLAREADKEALLNWRNNPNIMQFTRTKTAIPMGEHEIWFQGRLKILEREPIWIFTSGETRIGMTRLDLIDPIEKGFEVSILVDENYQNAGFGKKMLFRTCAFALDRLAAEYIRAEIHYENQASINLFSKLGFIKRSTNDEEFSTYDLKASSLIPLGS